MEIGKLMRYLEKLKDQCDQALKETPKRIFEMKRDSDLDGVGHAIYVIEEVGGDPEVTFNNFSRYRMEQSKKDKNTRRSCSALNAASRTMYVGSSTTGIGNRIRGHLGKGHKGTYALQLDHWFEGKYKITIRDYGDLDRAIIQLLEDDLSYDMKPAFGKKGSNGK